eukprot:scaffold61797_cov29-Prasinocladus_malaysianus.AAC.1
MSSGSIGNNWPQRSAVVGSPRKKGPRARPGRRGSVRSMLMTTMPVVELSPARDALTTRKSVRWVRIRRVLVFVRIRAAPPGSAEFDRANQKQPERLQPTQTVSRWLISSNLCLKSCWRKRV